MLTAAVRDLHLANPGKFETDVRTSADALWENNPYITRLDDAAPDVQTMEMHYPLIHQSNHRPYHFIHGYIQYLEEQLGLRIPVSKFSGDIYLSPSEKALSPSADLGVEIPEHFWILMAGGKYDFTAKWWNPASYQKVVDHFRGRITFLQCGESGHWHPPLEGVINLIGKTTTRQFVRLMYHASGVVCPVTFAMHLATAVETRPGRTRNRPCVVIAGGREPAQWEAYPHHQYISTNGMLSCCEDGGCWKSRCQLVGDGDVKDWNDLCEQPVQITPNLRIPRCLDMISPDDVIRRIEMYLQGEVRPRQRSANGATHTHGHPTNGAIAATVALSTRASTTSVKFYHGLGDCAYFAHLIPLYIKRGHQIEVECTPDKAILFEAAGAKVISAGASSNHDWGYPATGTHEGHGHFWQGSKMGHNVSEAPLPPIGGKDELWQEFVEQRIDVQSRISVEAIHTVDRWLDRLQKPIVLFHSRGNTGQERKSLPNETAEEFYREFINQCDGTLILLDWDNRVPRMASARIRHIGDLGSCPLDILLALMSKSDLMIGVDSGPLHTARFTDIPTIGVWMPGHYPTTYSLPRREQLNVVLADHTQQWNRFKRIPWNIVEHPGSHYEGRRLAELCAKMLSEPRYLSRADIAADVQLQQFVLEFCKYRGGSSSLTGFWDRNRSFDVTLRELSARSDSPTIVETGTIRSEEDWAGAGFGTYLFGDYVYRRGGKLHSVDLSPSNVAFSRTWTEVFGESVSIHEQDSLEFLNAVPQPIDLAYLDSLDTTEPNHADHAFRELQLVLPKLKPNGLVVFDDTPWNAGAFTGKGAKAVPWLIDQGWRVLYAGYQVVLAPSLGQNSF